MIAWQCGSTDWEWFFCAFLGAGVPQPSVSWHRLEGKLSANTISLENGSLLLHNLTLQDDGTYSCVASNAIGKASASSWLHVVGEMLKYFSTVSSLFNYLVLQLTENQDPLVSVIGTPVFHRTSCPYTHSHTYWHQYANPLYQNERHHWKPTWRTCKKCTQICIQYTWHTKPTVGKVNI